MKFNLSKPVQFVIAILLVTLLLWVANPRELLVSLEQVSPGEMILLLILSFVMIAVSALKWQFFIKALDIKEAAKIGIYKLCQFYLLGYFINMFLPSYVGGDALRSYYVGKSVGQHQAFSATLLERGTGFIAMLFLAIIAALLRSDLLGLAVGKFVILFSSIFLVTFIALILAGSKYRNRLFNFISNFSLINSFSFNKKIIAHTIRLFEVLYSIKVDLKGWVFICFLSVLFHSLTVLNTYYAACVVGWEFPPLQDLFVVLPIILMIGAIPVTPAGLGIQEGAFFHYLQLLGASPAQALAVAVVLRAKTIILAFLGWLVWLKIARDFELSSK